MPESCEGKSSSEKGSTALGSEESQEGAEGESPL